MNYPPESIKFCNRCGARIINYDPQAQVPGVHIECSLCLAENPQNYAQNQNPAFEGSFFNIPRRDGWIVNG